MGGHVYYNYQLCSTSFDITTLTYIMESFLEHTFEDIVYPMIRLLCTTTPLEIYIQGVSIELNQLQ